MCVSDRLHAGKRFNAEDGQFGDHRRNRDAGTFLYPSPESAEIGTLESPEVEQFFS
jgi:hypothetical protein